MNTKYITALNKALTAKFGKASLVKEIIAFNKEFDKTYVDETVVPTVPTAMTTRELIKQSAHPAKREGIPDRRTDLEKKHGVKIGTRGDSERGDAFRGNTPD